MSKPINNQDSVAKLESLASERPTILIGIGVVAVFLILFFAWGGGVPLATAAIAQGVVGVEGNKKRVQHLDGGIVSSIHVKEGDSVKAGQLLVKLNDVDIQSRYQQLNSLYIKSTAEYARWTAEQNGQAEASYPAWLELEQGGDASINNAVIAAQNDILNARQTVLNEARGNLALQLARVKEELRAAQNRIRRLNQKRQLIDAELSEYRSLEKKGLVTRTPLYELQLELTNLDLEISESHSIIELSEQESAQLTSQVTELESKHRKEAIENRTEVGSELETLKQQLAVLESELARTDIVAPIDGYVINSVVNTVGGVVAAGQVIMEIMPMDERLLIASRVDARDRDAVRPGQRAEVRFTAFSKRSTLPVEGVVKLISADSTFDPATQSAFYGVTIELVDDPTAALNGGAIYPGMQADILIVTGAQTFLQYLTAPISRSFNRAFRED